MKTALALTFLTLALIPIRAQAQVKLQGEFVATMACPAVQSIKKGTNSGNAAISPGAHYVLKGKNKETASHYWIEVPGAVPVERWVSVACGTTDLGAGQATSAVEKPAPAGGAFYVLALSWEPSFCEGLPGKAECKSMTTDRADAKQFSLHGLWPQPRRNVFCGVAQGAIVADDQHRWSDLPAPVISPAGKAALDSVMPGTQSLLERHEWIKHGTCYPAASAEQYFGDAVRLTTAINGSAVGEFVRSSVGKDILAADLRAAFDAAFFAGAGNRVRVACKPDGNRQLIAEITIGLKGDVPAGTAVTDLIRASAPTDPGCPHGVLDVPGLQ